MQPGGRCVTTGEYPRVPSASKCPRTLALRWSHSLRCSLASWERDLSLVPRLRQGLCLEPSWGCCGLCWGPTAIPRVLPSPSMRRSTVWIFSLGRASANITLPLGEPPNWALPCLAPEPCVPRPLRHSLEPWVWEPSVGQDRITVTLEGAPAGDAQPPHSIPS